MKLINYRYGYIKTSDSFYRGKIQMSFTEFVQAVKYLKRVKQLGDSYYSDTNKKLLRDDLTKRKYPTKTGFIVPLRVEPVWYLVRKYKLIRKYKKNNYFIEVITK